MLFSCLWRNVETSCHKHFVVASCHQQTPPLTASDKCHNMPQSGGAVLIAPDVRSVDSTPWSPILVGNRDFCLPKLPPLGRFTSEYRHDVWHWKTTMVWLSDGENVLNIHLFVSTESTNVTDGQTDRRTDTAWRHSPRGNHIRAILVPHGIIWSRYTGRWWVSCYIWYSEEELGRAAATRRYDTILCI